MTQAKAVVTQSGYAGIFGAALCRVPGEVECWGSVE